MNLLQRVLGLLFFALALISPSAATAQGCAACKDNASAAPPAFQQGLRHGILALMIPAGAGFGVFALWLLRKARTESEEAGALPPRV